MKEIWKDIEGYEGLYQVSNLGNVKSLGNGNSNNSKERILKPNKLKNGYLQVALCKNNKKWYKTHRLVAQAFLPNPNNYLEVNHKDEDKQNNCVDNLEYCNRKYNVDYSLSKQVLCVETGIIYPSTREAGRQLGFAQSHISSACNGKRKTAYGYTWRYVN